MRHIRIRTLNLLVLSLAGVVLSGLSSCNPKGTATITFHQVGSCNGWNDGTSLYSAGPNAAYVVFKVHSIDNTQGKVNFAFDPAKMWVNAGSPKPHMDPNLSLAKFMGVFALVPTNIPQGKTVGLDGFSVAVVQTANANGAVEANQTTYSLGYDTGSSDPGVLFVTDKTWVPLPQPTLDCTTITYQ